MFNRWFKIAALILFAHLLVAAGPATKPVPTTLPANVIAAQTWVRDWIDAMRGKSEMEVMKALGNDCERSTWKSGEQGGLKLRYKLGLKTTLDLYFSGGDVVYVDFDIDTGG